MAVVERFAPSPTGPLHLGHAYSAMTAHDAARAAGGRFLVRLEDLDAGRVRREHAQGQLDDLRWLGLRWDGPVLRQSARADVYAAALAELRARRLLYRCVCTRADIAAAQSAPQEGAPMGPVYPGLCRGRDVGGDRPFAWRLDLAAALDAVDAATLRWRDVGPDAQERGLDPAALLSEIGDVVLARKDGVAAYHLAVVVDDAEQGVTHVTRGADLAPATPLHRLLQALLGLPSPVWRHHRLIRDDHGRRLAKRDDARALASLRAEGAAPADIRRMVGL